MNYVMQHQTSLVAWKETRREYNFLIDRFMYNGTSQENKNHKEQKLFFCERIIDQYVSLQILSTVFVTYSNKLWCP